MYKCDVSTYFPWDNTQLFSRQVVKLVNEPPVEISITIQGSVMDIGLLFLLLHSWHPSGKHKNIKFTLASRQRKEKWVEKYFMRHLPFNIDIAHVLSSDAGFIQNDICCVPNDGSQKVSVLKILQHFTLTSVITNGEYLFSGLFYFLALRGLITHGGPGKPRFLGKMSTHIWICPWIHRKKQDIWMKMWCNTHSDGKIIQCCHDLG